MVVVGDDEGGGGWRSKLYRRVFVMTLLFDRI